MRASLLMLLPLASGCAIGPSDAALCVGLLPALERLAALEAEMTDAVATAAAELDAAHENGCAG